LARIEIPNRIDESNIFRLAELMSTPNDNSPIEIDMKDVKFTTPAAIVLILIRLHRWKRDGRDVFFINLSKCPALSYLQRMDFFTNCGIPLGECFERKDPRRRFIPIKQVNRSACNRIGELSAEVANCIFPELSDSCDPDQTGLYDAICYAVSELALNVVQHSRSDGFVHAQVYPTTRIVRLAIADYGIGIAQSFETCGSPVWQAGMSDTDAIRKAIESQVSSKTHLKSGWGEPVNAGVGLTLLSGLAKVTRGDFCMFSNRGFHRTGQADRILVAEASVCGTLCAITIPLDNLNNFAESLEIAKRNAGLIGRDDFTGMFL
jgi:hypothetical protein